MEREVNDEAPWVGLAYLHFQLLLFLLEYAFVLLDIQRSHSRYSCSEVVLRGFHCAGLGFDRASRCPQCYSRCVPFPAQETMRTFVRGWTHSGNLAHSVARTYKRLSSSNARRWRFRT